MHVQISQAHSGTYVAYTITIILQSCTIINIYVVLEHSKNAHSVFIKNYPIYNCMEYQAALIKQWTGLVINICIYIRIAIAYINRHFNSTCISIQCSNFDCKLTRANDINFSAMLQHNTFQHQHQLSD